MVTESGDFSQKPRMSLKQKWIWLEDLRIRKTPWTWAIRTMSLTMCANCTVWKSTAVIRQHMACPTVHLYEQIDTFPPKTYTKQTIPYIQFSSMVLNLCGYNSDSVTCFICFNDFPKMKSYLMGWTSRRPEPKWVVFFYLPTSPLSEG